MAQTWIALILLTFTAAAGAADVHIRVRPHVVVPPGTNVTLAQLIHAQGLSPAGEARAQETTLTKAPAYGERQELAPASLMEVLRPIVQAERMLTGRPVKLVMAKSVVVDTLKREISEEAVVAELLQAWQPLCLGCRLEIEGLSLPIIQGVRDWNLRIRSELPRGSFSVPVDIVRLDQAPSNAWISGRLIAKKRVPVAKRALVPNERLQTRDYDWEYRDISYATDGVAHEDELIGRKVRSGIRAGDILWANNLEKEKAIHRGELVQVKSGSGNWEVSMTLVAQQDAVVGDVINLKNPKTNGLMMGQVTGQGEVELR